MMVQLFEDKLNASWSFELMDTLLQQKTQPQSLCQHPDWDDECYKDALWLMKGHVLTTTANHHFLRVIKPIFEGPHSPAALRVCRFFSVPSLRRGIHDDDLVYHGIRYDLRSEQFQFEHAVLDGEGEHEVARLLGHILEKFFRYF